MLMSAVSAEENITVVDGTDSTSDYIELESDQGYIENNISENPILDDDVMDDDENISEEDVEQDNYPGSFDKQGASVDYGFNGASYSKTSSIKNFAVHKSSSCSHYSNGDDADVGDNENSIDAMLSNFQSQDVMGVEALNNIRTDFFEETYSSYRQYFDYLKSDSLKNLIEENKIGDVFNSNILIDFMNIDQLKYDLISFMDAGAKYVDLSIIDLSELNAFLDIFDKIMNSPSTHNVMTNIPSSNYNPMLRNHKYDSNYSDYIFYQDTDLMINSHDLNDDEMELFMESDSNISDMLIIQDNMTLMNQTFDLNTIPDVCINSFDMESDMELSDDVGCWRDAQDNSDKTVAMQSFKFSQQINCLSSNISENIQPTFYHMIGCECTNTSFTKQYKSYENLPKVSEFDTITCAEEEDCHDCVLFRKYNVNSPFIVENTSIFVLFGVIEIKIP